MRVTHPFHPLFGRQLPCIGKRYNRYGERLLLQGDGTTVWSVPPQWTDLVSPDPDAVQVKYEMLRRVSIDNASVTEASDEYGVSRPTYYQAKASFDAAGIAGLVPKKPGPRGPHKVQGEVLAFLQARLVPGEPVRARELASLIRAELGIEVHPRTIERALKKLPDEHATTPACSILSPAIAAQYEVLRMAALGEALPPTARSGLMLFLRRGMWVKPISVSPVRKEVSLA